MNHSMTIKIVSIILLLNLLFISGLANTSKQSVETFSPIQAGQNSKNNKNLLVQNQKPTSILRVGAKCGPSPHAMPLFFMLAKTNGKLADNVQLEYISVTEPSQMGALLHTNQVDAMLGFVVQTANMFQKGGLANLRLKNVFLWQGLYVVSTPDVKKWEDLLGRVVAMPNPKGGPTQLGKAAIRLAGFEPENDFSIQHMPESQIVQMLISGKAVAGVVTEPFATIAINKAKQIGLDLTVSEINLYGIFKSKNWNEGELPIEGLVTMQEVLDNPKKIAALEVFESAYSQAIDEMLANPNEAGKLIAEQLVDYCESRIDAKIIEKTIRSGRLLYRPTAVSELLPDIDSYIEEVAGIEIDDEFYAKGR